MRGVEARHPGLLCSVLLLDESGTRLRHGAAPSLPDFYNQAVDGLVIGEGIGSCGTAAFTGQRVVVEDIARHPFWQAYTELTARAGLGACWSQPIRDAAGRVRGTFAIYHRHPATPGADEFALIERYAGLAALILQRARDDAEIDRSRQLFELITENSNDVI